MSKSSIRTARHLVPHFRLTSTTYINRQRTYPTNAYSSLRQQTKSNEIKYPYEESRPTELVRPRTTHHHHPIKSNRFHRTPERKKTVKTCKSTAGSPPRPSNTFVPTGHSTAFPSDTKTITVAPFGFNSNGVIPTGEQSVFSTNNTHASPHSYTEINTAPIGTLSSFQAGVPTGIQPEFTSINTSEETDRSVFQLER
eukprot:TRINITY_DN2350_c0_g1_i1.p1 TRINITY_DN2350_c0_g1~~TRINITY_DN2350_c0_g1_i1.p1  ORF type:complete len:197 (+),score=6.11 TRINITY_DN2350_c0_g1_i1:118-708(+)